jgi:putative transcriptional regulator
VPIRIDIDMLLVKRKISSKELADAIQITPANLSILKTGKARAIRLHTLAALCRELDCQPGDLLVYVPGEESDIDYET